MKFETQVAYSLFFKMHIRLYVIIKNLSRYRMKYTTMSLIFGSGHKITTGNNSWSIFQNFIQSVSQALVDLASSCVQKENNESLGERSNCWGLLLGGHILYKLKIDEKNGGGCNVQFNVILCTFAVHIWATSSKVSSEKWIPAGTWLLYNVALASMQMYPNILQGNADVKGPY